MKLTLLAITISLIPNLLQLNGHPEIVESVGPYTRIQLTDSATLEVYEADNLIVLYTVCAPQCSTCARVYNKEWEFLFPIEPPTPSIFPFATLEKETGRIIWSDNNDWEYGGSPF